MNRPAYTLGLVSVSFRKHTPEEILEAAAAAGLTCIEWGSDVHAPCRHTERLREIAVLQKARGITCSSYGTYFRLGHTPLSELPDYIAAAGILGTDTLRLWGGDRSRDQMTDGEWDAFVATCREAAAMAEAAGVTLCLECHMRSVTERPEDAVALMEAVDSPRFRMYWQPFQWLDTAGSLAVAAAVAPYTQHVHVFNWAGNQKYPLADGAEAWQAYLRLLPPPRVLLLEFMPDDRIETLPQEASALRQIIGGTQ